MGSDKGSKSGGKSNALKIHVPEQIISDQQNELPEDAAHNTRQKNGQPSHR